MDLYISRGLLRWFVLSRGLSFLATAPKPIAVHGEAASPCTAIGLRGVAKKLSPRDKTNHRRGGLLAAQPGGLGTGEFHLHRALTNINAAERGRSSTDYFPKALLQTAAPPI